ncbi:glycoprotease family protein [Neorickettsia helminthoeca str. Oregon]|uniref:Glycoprotease family protein n=1 Tax=Neorickettsia helminthoeca str. Oregon TaxID=1286528 RepID=X5HKW8_9RICK|nr:hypothetical protein [Neorickettsia helminthoeca]AHX11729.1 glycoprotease family protein [Neorickettsia helminthoeca str. Oregon]
MNILSIDSSKEGKFSIAILKNGSICFSKTVEARLSEKLFHVLNPLREEILTEINILAINTGPGSYTGVRAGIAVLNGMSIGARKQLIGFDAFTVLLSKFRRDYCSFTTNDQEIAVLLKGYNDSFFYLQKFEKNSKKKTNPTRISVEFLTDLKGCTIISDTAGYGYVYETSAEDISLLASDPEACRGADYLTSPLYVQV